MEAVIGGVPSNQRRGYAQTAFRESSLSGVARRRDVAAAWLVLLLVAMLAAPAASFARRLPGEQVAAHLVDVALREWREWGEALVDARDGTARLERTGAHESDTAPFDAQAHARLRALLARARDDGDDAQFELLLARDTG